MPTFPGRRRCLTALCVLVLSFALCVTQVLGWGCVGHMIVAEIARRRLSPANQEKIGAMAMAFGKSGPFRLSPDMVQAACWSDDLKIWHQYAMNSWHFVDTPYNPENITITDAMDPVNIINVTTDMMLALRHSKSPMYVLNFAWVSLVHLMGDLHQPLHAVTFYSKHFPHGDRGGNSIKVRVHGKEVRLHALWDSLCNVTLPHYPRPLSSTDYSAITEAADQLEDTYKFSTEMMTLRNTTLIASESFAFAVNTSYAGLTPGMELSDDYLERCAEVAKGRLTLGGYRLGNILDDLLENIPVDDGILKEYRATMQNQDSTPTTNDNVVRLRGHSH
ncbi:hypothetical protein JKF63_02938 [Porcisia hertigi]|uniref:P1/s1 nuclease n=1 Tax=Porcisia hertigi TaxID=2761500 RepID=A0A836L683_9TRYP|nr:hypothetical protein JKF63_02938 [Porcisia hertigi]